MLKCMNSASCPLKLKRVTKKKRETTETLEMQTWVEIISTQMHTKLLLRISQKKKKRKKRVTSMNKPMNIKPTQ